MKVKRSKKIKPIIYYLSIASTALTLIGCSPVNSINGFNANVITNTVDIEDYLTEYDTPQESDYLICQSGYDVNNKRFIVKYNKLFLESSIYVSSNPSMYGYQPVDLDELNKYSVYYINPLNEWIEPYLNDKNYTCKNISIERYIDEEGQEYILYKCDVYVVNDFDNGKTIELSGKVWPIQDIAHVEPVAPVESFYLTYTALSKIDDKDYVSFVADKEEGYDNSCINGDLDSILTVKKSKIK